MLFCGNFGSQETSADEIDFPPQAYYPLALAEQMKRFGEDAVVPATNCEQARKQMRLLDKLPPTNELIESFIEHPDSEALPAYLDEQEHRAVRDSPYILDGESPSELDRPIVTIGFANLDPGSVERWYYCTGFVVSRRHVLTAAHCAAGDGTQMIDFHALSGNIQMPLKVRMHVHPNYNGRVQDLGGNLEPSFDLALIEMPVFQSTNFMSNASDRYRIHTGTTVKQTRLQIRGTGVKEESESPDSATPGSAEQPPGNGRIRVSGHEMRYFVAKATSRVGACKGDSGGPAIEHGRFWKPIVWGAYSGFQSSNKFCPLEGERMYWTKTNMAKDWIEDTMKELFGPDFRCGRYGDASKGTTYRRCW